MHVGTFVGRLGQDVEVKVTQSGQQYAKMSIACDMGKDKEGEKRSALWIRATIWGKRAESLAPHLKKGTMVAVCGDIDLNSWTGKDEETHTEIQCNVQTFSFAGGAKQDGGESKPKEQQQSSGGITDEDIPF